MNLSPSHHAPEEFEPASNLYHRRRSDCLWQSRDIFERGGRF